MIAEMALSAGLASDVFTVAGASRCRSRFRRGLLSRVPAYDGLGSYALAPVGTLLAGPAALVVGVAAALAGGGGAMVVSAVVVLCVSEIRTLSRRPSPRVQTGSGGVHRWGWLAAPLADVAR